MAAPNLVNTTSLYGKTVYGALTTSAGTILSNAAASGKLLKVVSFYVANIDGTDACDLTASLYSQDDLGGTAYAIVKTVSVPADATIIVVDSKAPILLEEDRSIGALASANSDLEYVLSYEEYDDA